MDAISRYFDHNATTPMGDAAKAAWIEVTNEAWHNPSSLYREAGEARNRLENMREQLADAFDIDDPERVVFKSGATEANNAVIRHLSRNLKGAIAITTDDGRGPIKILCPQYLERAGISQ